MTAGLLAIDQFVAALAADHPPVVLDVRELAESAAGHIPGATLLPRRRLEFRIDALVRDRATPIVAVDSGELVDAGLRDPRAALAAETLAALGYRAVAALDGGLAAWRQAQRPTVSGTQAAREPRAGASGRVAAIDVATLRQWQQSGRRVALCDVRRADEHTHGCIPGAVSLPGFEAASHALDMAGESDVIVLYSGGRTRGLLAAQTLVDLGLGEVVTLAGGVLEWQLAGHELERGSRRRRVRPSAASRQFAELGSALLARQHGVEPVEAAELGVLVQANGNFSAFDLRNLGQHNVAHVPGSVSLASDVLIARRDELVAVRDAPVVLIDDDAVRAQLTGVWLHRLGQARVRTLAGGFAAWARGGYPARTAAEMPLGWSAACAAAAGLGADDVARWLAVHAPARVLHVDGGASWRRAHLPGAVWLPRGWLEARIAGMAPSREEALLVTCSDGAQSAYAAATLCRLGYGQVAWLQGGTRAWAGAGGALETAPPRLDDAAHEPAPDGRDDIDWESLVS